jgi:hypothetical protein
MANIMAAGVYHRYVNLEQAPFNNPGDSVRLSYPADDHLTPSSK